MNTWGGADCFEDFIVCPHCGTIDHEYCEYPRELNHDGDVAETECSECGKPLKVTLCASYSYATAPLPEAAK